ncbi:PerC family transcriptional regulator [Klebsiella oxytoca]|uniref:PerC family transcriptional regulator n=1 Tax=Klebsiella oxytoca TaxID=571 RepID=UPI001CCA80DC|nr:PerC family transcriptional regulator [Klebsiella oxytoca]MBZ7262449.1 PerC family transcriptional regulator [Klebsiella oxytoca]
MKRPIRELIVGFVQANPGSNIHDICEAIYLDHSCAYGHLASLIKSKILISHRSGRENKYQASPGILLENPYEKKYRCTNSEKVKHAEKQAAVLAEKGFHRRAATLLTEVIGLVNTESDVRRIASIRTMYLKNARRTVTGASL